MVFTLPHQFNGLAKRNEKIIYSMIMRASWLTVSTLMSNTKVGMTSVLHTFGCAMNFHVHVHALVTFGGLDPKGLEQYPSCKYALAKYRALCSTFKSQFIKELQKEIKKGNINYHLDIDQLINESLKVRWVVYSTYPTMQTQTIEDYLAKYINRVGVTNNRLAYIKDKQTVILQYNDYKKQQYNKAAPKAYTNLEPLTVIHQILQHVLPPYFQKSRHHGLHSATQKIKASIPCQLQQNSRTIRTVFEIITHLLQIKPFTCDQCQSTDFIIIEIEPLKSKNHLIGIQNSTRAPPVITPIKPVVNLSEAHFR